MISIRTAALGATALALTAAVAGCAAPANALSDAVDATAPITYSYTGGVQEYVVPQGVTSLTLSAVGGAGGGRVAVERAAGATVTGSLPVTAGQTLLISVGGAGGDADDHDDDPKGGWGGLNGSGGDGKAETDTLRNSSAGGGATTIQITDSGGADPTTVIVAGGGGGAGGQSGDIDGYGYGGSAGCADHTSSWTGSNGGDGTSGGKGGHAGSEASATGATGLGGTGLGGSGGGGGGGVAGGGPGTGASGTSGGGGGGAGSSTQSGLTNPAVTCQDGGSGPSMLDGEVTITPVS